MSMSLKHAAVAATAVLVLTAYSPAHAVEEAEYTVLKTDGEIELRDYAPSIVAETSVESDFESASSKAFRLLFRYIDGENEAQGKIAMTAPVSQEPVSRKIAMTAPVSQEETEAGWRVSFMMPAAFTMETIPLPTNPAVRLRELPAYRAALDLPGEYAIPALSRSVIQLLDSLGIERTHVVGHSLGGMIAQQLAVGHPQRVGKLVLAVSARINTLLA